jgi:hypothetical protein
MPISDKLIDELLKGCSTPQDILGESGLLKELTQRVVERALEAEMEQHLGYAKHASAGANSGNSRNGKNRKSVRSVHGEIELAVPRDRNSSFEPQLVKKGEKQLNGFDERIISLYAKGMGGGKNRPPGCHDQAVFPGLQPPRYPSEDLSSTQPFLILTDSVVGDFFNNDAALISNPNGFNSL